MFKGVNDGVGVAVFDRIRTRNTNIVVCSILHLYAACITANAMALHARKTHAACAQIWRIYVEWAIASWHWTLSNYTTSYAFEITIYAIGCGSGVVWWQPSNGFQQSRTYLMPNTGAHGSTPRSTERVLIHIHDVERWWLKLQRFAIPFSTSA